MFNGLTETGVSPVTDVINIFDPWSEWTDIPAVPGSQAYVVLDGRFVSCDGQHCSVYDPSVESWAHILNRTDGLWSTRGIVKGGNKLWLTGGHTSVIEYPMFVISVVCILRYTGLFTKNDVNAITLPFPDETEFFNFYKYLVDSLHG